MTAGAHRLPRTFLGLRWGANARAVVRTAGFNVASTVAAGLAGLLLARALGPSVRGEYAAITSWFSVGLMVGGMGQPAALCYYVARDPDRAPAYAATSRALMLVTGTAAIGLGLLLAPVLARGSGAVAAGYRIAFGASVLAFVGASYTFALQARDLRRWNVVRVSQPAAFALVIGGLWAAGALTLDRVMTAMLLTMAVQLAWAYRCCRQTGLAPGRARAALARPLAGYGAAQIAALTPAVLNSDLDKLVLSQVVQPADLGRYAVAVSLTLLPMPLVTAIGNVAFPRLAAQRTATAAAGRAIRLAVAASAGLAAAVLVPLAVACSWLVPLVFGPGYRGAVPLVWILVPGAVFLACGQVAGDLLRGRNLPIVVARAQGTAAVCTVALLAGLLPLIGIYGAAVASTVAYGVALCVLLRRLWRLPGDGPAAAGQAADPAESQATARRRVRPGRAASRNSGPGRTGRDREARPR